MAAPPPLVIKLGGAAPALTPSESDAVASASFVSPSPLSQSESSVIVVVPPTPALEGTPIRTEQPQPPPARAAPTNKSERPKGDRRFGARPDIWNELLNDVPRMIVETVRTADDATVFLLRSASVNRIIFQAVLDFPMEDRGRHTETPEFTLASTFLTAYRWVLHPTGLLSRLLDLHDGPSQDPAPASGLTHSRSSSFEEGLRTARGLRTPSFGSVEPSEDSSFGLPSPCGIPTNSFLLTRWSFHSPADVFADEQLWAAFRRRVVLFLRFWLERQPHDFQSMPMQTVLGSFVDRLRNVDAEQAALLTEARLVANSTMPSATAARMPHVAMSRRLIPAFDAADPAVLAAQFTALEFDYYRNVRPSDFYSSSWRNSSGQLVSPHLFLSIQHFNRISYWVVAMILSEAEATRRMLVYGKLIRVARKLRALKNYNTLMAFVGGLRHQAVYRLKDTFDALPRKLQTGLQEICDFLSPDQNFETYRRDVEAQKGFCIPYLGLTLADVTHLGDTLGVPGADQLMINWQRLAQIAHATTKALSFQSESLPVEPDPALMQVLRATLFPVATEAEFYELSLLREPRQTGHRRTNSARRPSFSEAPIHALSKNLEWFFPSEERDRHGGEAVMSATEAFRSSLEEMVGTLFNTFDADKNKELSEEEFKRLASFFPLLPPFRQLDKNGDGVVSADELVTFFLTARNILKPCEDHKLTLHTNIRAGSRRCFACNRVLFGVSGKYLGCGACGMIIHQRCALKMEPEKEEALAEYLKPTEPSPRPRSPTMHLLSSNEEQPVGADLPRKNSRGSRFRALFRFFPSHDRESSRTAHEA